MNVRKLLGTTILFGSVALILAATLLINAWLSAPLPLKESVTVKIKSGMNGRDIARLLQRNGVIESSRAFRWAIWFKNAERNLKGGTVKLNPPLSLTELIDELQEKRPLLVSVQLQEGWPSWRIFEQLSKRLNLPRSQFEKLFDDRRFLDRLGIPSSTLEGYLFPDTYYISADADARAVLKQIVNRFREIQGKIELKKRARRIDFTINEAVTLASIIAREAGMDRERRLISAVFHNRLRDEIPLEADPTVLYPFENFQATITYSMLRDNHRYNTYQRPGLPPTPIANPGESSLRASVDPADVPYRFFVSKGDGTHEFSETLNEHEEAVDRYQR